MVKQDLQNEHQQWQTEQKQKVKTLGLCTFFWLVATALLAFGPKFLWDFNTLLTVIAVIVNLLTGTAMIMANRAHLRSLDEMQQKIQSEAMALSLGVGLVVGCCYQLLHNVRLISFQPELAHMVIVMCLTYMIGMIKGGVKYR
ncbi:hypothetical protein E2K93_08010 [Thalassotalea sp. HSM 43]|uniref:hypothetical protein n=1 Tax=Thalassotalea sp. HSM 43 TaxID=2552945 RepID=UPI001081DB10|nr:hypothetical protein [Thalassotalea sp. HSM 43]QBY04339.1 hypothetical protein E2K93_08010 [Thalassotalea sp. HSM 43]